MVDEKRKEYMRNYMAARRAANKVNVNKVNVNKVNVNKVNSDEISPDDIGLQEKDLDGAKNDYVEKQPVGRYPPIPFVVDWNNVPNWIWKRLVQMRLVKFL